MAENTFQLEIVTPERSVWSLPVTSVMVPAHTGYLGILAGHAPLLCTLTTGEVKIHSAHGEHHMALSGGFMEVAAGKVIVLADSAEHVTEIDAERVKRARDHALKLLANGMRGRDREHAEAALERAANRLKVLDKYAAKAKPPPVPGAPHTSMTGA
ncbi:MAG: F0F1 ATP synthase subunit epsilon [Planctomycetes bacterium]|nr:F0F1 ATP synthase subunit epsilon [Planctomycetota bacterium]